MNYFRSKNTNLKKFLNKKTSVAALILVSFFSIFSSYFVQSQGSTLPDCKTFSGNLQPGENCLFYGMPLCQSIPSATYAIPNSSVLIGATANHRSNCADLSDLPLCSQMDNSSSANPIKDCVKECSDPGFDSGSGLRGIDFAVHNRDCVRFCDAPEVGINAAPGINCIGRTCHQLPAGTDPQPGINCELRICNLLTPDELNETKLDDDTKQYCDGSTVKCYEFTRAQLPYIKLRLKGKNPTCNIHNCRVADSCVRNATDDRQKIEDKAALDPQFLSEYQTHAFFGYAIADDTMCSPVSCNPVFYRQYRCEPMADTNPKIVNVNCDSDLGCPSGYCKKKIDCNIPANVSEPECIVSNSPGSPPTVDNTNSWFYRPIPDSGSLAAGSTIKAMQSNLCYNTDDMDDHFGGDKGIFGYFHWNNRSPGKCGASDLGFRGTGYGYLCGTNGLAYDTPQEERTAFFEGYANSTYTDKGGTHSVKVCLRYNNTLDPQESCGRRECMIICAFGACSQHCGFDKCKTLTIDDTNPRECMMNNSLFSDNKNKGCMQKIDNSANLDSYLRLRAVKYGRNICGFLDLKGIFAYSGSYFDGSEKLSDGTCFSGDNANGSCSNGKNTNDTPGLADVWRTVMRVHYIDDNRPSGPKGYLDKDGRLFREQECPRVAYRVITPKHYNLANITNSPNLFTPPMYIMNARIKRGGAISNPTSGSGLGATDFHYPELEVRFGTTTKKLSLGIDYTGYEALNSGDPSASATITTNIDNFDYTAEVFVRKEQIIDAGIANPTFCLYRRIQDLNGAYIEPLRIGCVARKLAEIDNSAQRAFDPLIDFRRVLVNPHASTTFDSPKISFRYLSSSQITSAACGTAGVECTAEILLENPVQETVNCFDNIESSKICVQREECSRLNIECMQNEIALNNASNSNLPIDSFLTVRRNCSEILLPLCNSKKGLTSQQVSNLIDFDYNASPTNPQDPNFNLYGWHNEMCITSGFESKLKNVIAHQMPNGNKGKCDINPNSPYLLDGDPSTTCDSGGKAPNCLCVNAVEGVAPNAGYEVRTQTLREAGLCIDIPLPKICSAIDYNQTPNPTVNDLEYVLSSLNNNSYGSSVNDINGKVHISHLYRSQGKAAPNAILLRGHAEFPATIFGVNNVVGECKGFWTYKRSAGGNILTPKLNCINSGGNAVWESSARDACIRFKCDQIFTSGPDQTGIYQGTYGTLETGENKGLTNGFALWAEFTKTNDFLETTTANSCITGFKKTGAIAKKANGAEVTGSAAVNAALYQQITGYNGGTLPTRQCNQIGQWQATTNNCQRITCPAVTPPTPADSNDTAAWELWRNSGGATFPSVNASRSDSRIQPESVATGTCNTNLGFSASPGGDLPTRKCDHLGNWLPVENECVTTCDAITNPADASNFNNGFATWDKISSVFDPNGAQGTFLGCVAGYKPNPYPPSVDIRGNPLAPAIANNLTRPAENPKRLCTIGAPSNLGIASNVWTAVVNGCINQCPGYSEDPRVGVGRTVHPIQNSNGNVINLDWTATPLGQDAYISNFNNPANLDASYFEKPLGQARSNGNYLVKRHCNLDGKWSDPEPMCATNNGQIANAKYDSNPLTSGYSDSIAAGTSQNVTGSCITNYWKSNLNVGAAPLRSCQYENANNYIDQVYLGLINNTLDCEEKRCPARPAYLGDRISLPAIAANDNRTRQGTRTSATCLNNQPNSTGAIVFTSIVGGDSSPYIECQSNGVWSQVYNETKCQLGCDFSALDVRVDSNQCGNGDRFVFNNFSLKSGQTVELNFYSGCGEHNDDCDAYRYLAKCVNSTKYLYQDYVEGGAIASQNINHDSESGHQCPYSSFNQSTNTWNPVSSRAYCGACHDSVINGVISNQYINKYNQSSSFSIQYYP